DIAGPEGARKAVETETPGVAQAIGVDFRPGSLYAGEGIVGRDDVAGIAGDIEAQDGAKQVPEVLAVTLRVERVATVAQGHVEVTVRPESNVATVMVGPRLRHFQKHLLR